MSSVQEFNDLSFVQGLPVRKGLKESPKLRIPKEVLIQVSQMIASKQIRETTEMPPQLKGRVPIGIAEETGYKPKQQKETVFVGGDGTKTRCIGDECVAENELRDPTSLYSESTPFSVSGEYSVSDKEIHQLKIKKEAQRAMVSGFSKLQDYITTEAYNLAEKYSSNEYANQDIDSLISNELKQKLVSKAREFERRYPIDNETVEQIYDSTITLLKKLINQRR